MNHPTVATDGLTPTLPEALITQDFDEVLMSCP